MLKYALPYSWLNIEGLEKQAEWEKSRVHAWSNPEKLRL